MPVVEDHPYPMVVLEAPKRDKNGRAYGWSSTVFTTVEDFWAVRGRSLGKEDPERAYAVLLARLRTLRPDLEPSRSEKALRG